MPVTCNQRIHISGYKDKKAKRFMEDFNSWIEEYIIGNCLSDMKEMTPIMNEDFMTLYSSYNVSMGKWFNKPDPQSDDAKWLDNLGENLKKHDDKFLPKYRVLRNKIAKASKLKIVEKKNKAIRLVKDEAEKLFKDAWDNLEKILKKAANDAEFMPEKRKMSEDEELPKNLIFICKEDIQNLIKALSYKLDVMNLYDQLGISDYETSEGNDAIITTAKFVYNNEIRKDFASRLISFKDLISGVTIDNSSFCKELAPIILKGICNSSKIVNNISGSFSGIFSEFMSRGKGNKTSHTAKWCRGVLEDIQKHERDYVPKYERLRKEIKAMLASNPTQRSKNTVEEMKQRAIKLFEDARKSLQGVLDRAAKKAKRTLSITSIVFLEHKAVQNLADEFRRVKANEEELWKVLTKGKLN